MNNKEQKINELLKTAVMQNSPDVFNEVLKSFKNTAETHQNNNAIDINSRNKASKKWLYIAASIVLVLFVSSYALTNGLFMSKKYSRDKSMGYAPQTNNNNNAYQNKSDDGKVTNESAQDTSSQIIYGVEANIQYTSSNNLDSSRNSSKSAQSASKGDLASSANYSKSSQSNSKSEQSQQIFQEQQNQFILSPTLLTLLEQYKSQTNVKFRVMVSNLIIKDSENLTKALLVKKLETDLGFKNLQYDVPSSIYDKNNYTFIAELTSKEIYMLSNYSCYIIILPPQNLIKKSKISDNLSYSLTQISNEQKLRITTYSIIDNRTTSIIGKNLLYYPTPLKEPLFNYNKTSITRFLSNIIIDTDISDTSNIIYNADIYNNIISASITMALTKEEIIRLSENENIKCIYFSN